MLDGKLQVDPLGSVLKGKVWARDTYTIGEQIAYSFNPDVTYSSLVSFHNNSSVRRNKSNALGHQAEWIVEQVIPDGRGLRGFWEASAALMRVN